MQFLSWEKWHARNLTMSHFDTSYKAFSWPITIPDFRRTFV